ncbi:CYTH domain-containing protein [Flavobacterium sp. AG291]|uniref:CYTH domain-containing protein n=1 Tax=Flavobacterium sp. AG291 TaxID=2184000 RepID=UPI000E0C483A|nr:CYTH domain-containing protein [Flavobacterium sp. AG291]RDI11883.1 CYTH domain-containing protein [Flavobacterium sp. AG291]
MIEIERKFLVLSDAYKNEAVSRKRIAQGYLNSNPERTVRVRTKGDQGFLTIKGAGNESGTSRFEWEKEIPADEAQLLLTLCESGSINKIRYEVKVGKHTFEVDEFFGANAGLVIAEVELNDENESFEKPQWLGEEVTGNTHYYNAFLSNNPYSTWKK